LLLCLLLGCSSTATHARPVPSPPRPSGETGKSADAVIADARKDLLAATSVHVIGTFRITAVAQPTDQRIDLQLTKVNGQPAATGRVATLTGTGAKTVTVTLAIIRLGNAIYIRGNRAWYARIGPKAVAVAGRWLSLPISQDRSLADLTDLSAVAAGITPTATDRIRGTERLGSVPVVDVMAGTDATLYVAASGTPRLLRLTRSMTAPAGVNGTLDFSDYDAAVAVRAPTGAIPITKVRA
jgi:hypothetical protein